MRKLVLGLAVLAGLVFASVALADNKPWSDAGGATAFLEQDYGSQNLGGALSWHDNYCNNISIEFAPYAAGGHNYLTNYYQFRNCHGFTQPPNPPGPRPTVVNAQIAFGADYMGYKNQPGNGLCPESSAIITTQCSHASYDYINVNNGDGTWSMPHAIFPGTNDMFLCDTAQMPAGSVWQPALGIQYKYQLADGSSTGWEFAEFPNSYLNNWEIFGQSAATKVACK